MAQSNQSLNKNGCKKSDFEAALKQYEVEVKNSHSLRFALIEEKFSSLANKTFSPKLKETKEKYEKCENFKGKLMNIIQLNRSVLKCGTEGYQYLDIGNKQGFKLKVAKDKKKLPTGIVDNFLDRVENEILLNETFSDDDSNDSLAIEDIDKWSTLKGSHVKESKRNNISKSLAAGHNSSESFSKNKRKCELPNSNVNNSARVKKFKNKLGNSVDIDPTFGKNTKTINSNKKNSINDAVTDAKKTYSLSKRDSKTKGTLTELSKNSDQNNTTNTKRERISNLRSPKPRNCKQTVTRKNHLKMNTLLSNRNKSMLSDKEELLNFIQPISDPDTTHSKSCSKYCVLMEDLSFYVKSSFKKGDKNILYAFPLVNNMTSKILNSPVKKVVNVHNEESYNTHLTKKLRKLSDNRVIENMNETNSEKQQSYPNKLSESTTLLKTNFAQKQSEKSVIVEQKGFVNSDFEYNPANKNRSAEECLEMVTVDLLNKHTEHQETQRKHLFKVLNLTRTSEVNQDQSQDARLKKFGSECESQKRSSDKGWIKGRNNISRQRNLYMDQNNFTCSLHMLNESTSKKNTLQLDQQTISNGKQQDSGIDICDSQSSQNISFETLSPENELIDDQQTMKNRSAIMSTFCNSYSKNSTKLKTTLATIDEEADLSGTESSQKMVSLKSQGCALEIKNNPASNGSLRHAKEFASTALSKKTQNLTLRLESVEPVINSSILPLKREEYEMNFAAKLKSASIGNLNHTIQPLSSVKIKQSLKLRLGSVEPVINSSVLPLKRKEYEISVAEQLKSANNSNLHRTKQSASTIQKKAILSRNESLEKITTPIKSQSCVREIKEKYGFSKEKPSSNCSLIHTKASVPPSSVKKTRSLKLRLESVKPIINSSILPLKREEYEMSVAAMLKSSLVKNKKNQSRNITNASQSENLKSSKPIEMYSGSSKKILHNNGIEEDLNPVDLSTGCYSFFSVGIDSSRKESSLLDGSFYNYKKIVKGFTTVD